MSKISSPLHLSRITLALGGILAAAIVYAQPAAAPGTPAAQQQLSQEAPYPCEMGSWGEHRGGYGGGHWGGRGGHRGGYGGGHWGGGYMMGDAQLTPAQQDQMRTLSQTTQEQALALRNQLTNVQIQLNDALAQPNLDKPAIAKLQTQQADLRQKLTTLHDNARVQAIEVLTPEQRTTMNQRMQNARTGAGVPPCMSGDNGNYHRRGGHRGRY